MTTVVLKVKSSFKCLQCSMMNNTSPFFTKNEKQVIKFTLKGV